MGRRLSRILDAALLLAAIVLIIVAACLALQAPGTGQRVARHQLCSRFL